MEQQKYFSVDEHNKNESNTDSFGDVEKSSA